VKISSTYVHIYNFCTCKYNLNLYNDNCINSLLSYSFGLLFVEGLVDEDLCVQVEGLGVEAVEGVGGGGGVPPALLQHLQALVQVVLYRQEKGA
jgi:hypothetical protein